MVIIGIDQWENLFLVAYKKIIMVCIHGEKNIMYDAPEFLGFQIEVAQMMVFILIVAITLLFF